MRAAFFCLLLAAPAAADCPVRFVDDPLPGLEKNYAAACDAAVKLRPRFEALRHLARLDYAELALSHDMEVNAMYKTFDDGSEAMVLNAGLLARAPSEEVMNFVLAHELGHGVQRRLPVFKERDRKIDEYGAGRIPLDELMAFKRRYEAFADAIGLELLSRAGVPGTAARGGAQSFFSCDAKTLAPEPHGSHPGTGRRSVNAALLEPLVTDMSLRKTARGGFDGADPHAGELDLFGMRKAWRDAEAAEAARRAPPYRPGASMDDFTEDGTFLPGRLAYRGLGRNIPAPHQGLAAPAVLMAEHALGRWVAPAYVQTVNRLSGEKPLVERTLGFCGLPGAEEDARGYGPWSWSWRVVQALTRRNEPPPELRRSLEEAAPPAEPAPPLRGTR